MGLWRIKAKLGSSAWMPPLRMQARKIPDKLFGIFFEVSHSSVNRDGCKLKCHTCEN
jgi:hypothetical protein